MRFFGRKKPKAQALLAPRVRARWRNLALLVLAIDGVGCSGPSSPLATLLEKERAGRGVGQAEISGATVLVTPAEKVRFVNSGSSTAVSCRNLADSPVVEVLNSDDSRDTVSSIEIILEAFSDSNCTSGIGPSLSASDLSVSTSSGLAAFSQMKISGRIGSFYLRARNTDSTLQTSCTGPLVIAPGAATLAYALAPSGSAPAGVYLGMQPKIEIRDECGVRMSDESHSASIGSFSNASCTLESSPGTLSVFQSTVQTSGGLGEFSNVRFLKSGSHYLGVAVPGFPTLCTAVTVSAGSAHHLGFSTYPSSIAVAGINWAQVPEIEVRDAFNNRVGSSSAVISLTPYSDSGCTLPYAGTLSSSSVTASSGIASPPSLSANRSGSLYIQASSAGLTSVCSSLVSVNPGAATQLIFTTSPPSVANPSQTFSSQPAVAVADSLGNGVPSSGVTVTLEAHVDATCTSPAPDTFSVSSNPLVTSGAGVVQFAGVSYAGQTPNLRLKASASGLTSVCSAADTQVSAGAATRLRFTQPLASQSAIAGAAFGVQPTVEARDDSGVVPAGFTSLITVSAFLDSTCTTPAATALSGSSSVAATAGASIFTGLSYTKAGTLYFKATSPGLTSDCSAAVNVSPASASELHFATQPSGSVVAGSPLIDSPVIEVRDAFGNRVVSASTAITLSAFTDSSCTVSAPTGLNADQLSVTSQSGVSPFSNVSYTRSGNLYIRASGGGFNRCSQLVSVLVGAASKLRFSVQPSSASTEICTSLGTSPTVVAEDTYGNLVTSYTTPVLLEPYADSSCSTASPAGSQVTATANPKAAVAGVSVFSSTQVNLRGLTSSSGVAYVRARSGVLESACSSAVNLTALTKSVAITSQPTAGTAGVALSSGFIAEVRDSCNQKFDFGSYVVSMLLTSDPACVSRPPWSVSADSLSKTTVNQAVNFSNIVITEAGSHYLRAFHVGATPACSSVLSISAGSGSKLTFVEQPLLTPADIPLTPTFAVGVTDAYGNIQTSETDSITLSAHSDSSCSTAALTSSDVFDGPPALTQSTSSGVAHYPGLRLKKSGSLYFKATSSSTFGSACSRAVDVHWGGQLNSVTQYGTCYTTGSGANLCWGSSNEGNRASTVSTPVPQRVRGISRTWKVASGDFSSCYLLVDGTVRCLGRGSAGQLGVAGTSKAVLPQTVQQSGGGDLSNVIDLAGNGVGGNFGSVFCTVKLDGSVWCWGGSSDATNSSGAMGNGVSGYVNVATQVSGITDALSVSVGDRFACVTRKSGTISCWGNNTHGAVGDGTDSHRLAPVEVVGLNRAASISMSRTATCAIRLAGDLWCWGRGVYGALANGDDNTSKVPVRGGSEFTFKGLFGSTAFVEDWFCGVLSSGGIRCWGTDEGYLLGGVVDQYIVRTPTNPFPSVSLDVVSASASYFDAHVVARDGTVWSWGRNGSSASGTLENGIYGFPTDHTDFSQFKGVSQLSSAPSSVSLHTCIVTGDGQLKCSGSSGNGVLGLGSTGLPTLVRGLTDVPGMSTVTQVSTSDFSTCAVQAGEAWCWGTNNYSSPTLNGALGVGSVSEREFSPVKVSALGSSVEQVVTLGRSSCARLTDGSVRCWGDNSSGQLGQPLTLTSSTSPQNVTLPLGRTALEIAGALYSTSIQTYCALLDNGSVACWGNGAYGMLGDGGSTASASRVVTTPAVIAGGIADVLEIKAGAGTFCIRRAAADASGNIKCWGVGTRGQIGNAAALDVSTPTSASLSGDVTLGLAVSSRSVCVISSDRSVKCWGEGGLGENAQGYLYQQSTTPNTQGAVSNVEAIFSSGQGFAAVDYQAGSDPDHWWVWGKNAPSQLGGGENQYMASRPWMVQLPPRLAAGSQHTCFVRGEGKVYCWGSNSSGQLGLVGGDQLSPVEVPGISDAYTVAAGDAHTCVVRANGQVLCWGNDGQNNYGSTPTLIGNSIGTTNGLSGNTLTYNTDLQVSRVTAGKNHTCITHSYFGVSGALPDGAVTPRMLCWGMNGSGQILLNNTTPLSSPGAYVTSLRLFTHYYPEIPFAGGDRTCFVANGGVYRCGGENSQFELNLGDSVDKLIASTLPLMRRPLLSLAMGVNHTCGGFSDFSDRVACWGSHGLGQLGDGSSAGDPANNTSVSKVFSVISGEREIYPQILGAGDHHTCVGLRSGGLECWGSNSDGQLGNGVSGGSAASPVSVGPLTGEAREVVGGSQHTCVRTTSAIQCFGGGASGQLGNGAGSSSSSPVSVSLLQN